MVGGGSVECLDGMQNTAAAAAAFEYLSYSSYSTSYVYLVRYEVLVLYFKKHFSVYDLLRCCMNVRIT